MEMRLGKTLVCIRFVESFSFKPKVLVVAPVEGLWAWKRELGIEGYVPNLLTGTKTQRLSALEFSTSNWFLINYEGFLSIKEDLGRHSWEVVILDESRRIANPKSKTSKALVSSPRFKNQSRIILCGEPAPESPLEYFQQYAFVNKQFLGCKNFWEYRYRYFHELAPHEWLPIPSKLAKLKEEIRNEGFFLSRKQAGLKNTKVREVRTLELPKDVRKTYEEIRKEFVATYKGEFLKSTKYVPVQYIWMHQLASGFLGGKLLWDGKIVQLIELLQGELSKEQVVVWFKYNAPLNEVSKRLSQKGISHGKILGTESRESREDAIDFFRKGNVRVLLCQIKCGKTAIDLSNSSTAIYFSNSYSLEERLQSEDRILNPAKTEPLLYIDLVGKDTVEEEILEILQDKKGNSNFFKSTLLKEIVSAR